MLKLRAADRTNAIRASYEAMRDAIGDLEGVVGNVSAGQAVAIQALIGRERGSAKAVEGYLSRIEEVALPSPHRTELVPMPRLVVRYATDHWPQFALALLVDAFGPLVALLAYAAAMRRRDDLNRTTSILEPQLEEPSMQPIRLVINFVGGVCFVTIVSGISLIIIMKDRVSGTRRSDRGGPLHHRLSGGGVLTGISDDIAALRASQEETAQKNRELEDRLQAQEAREEELAALSTKVENFSLFQDETLDFGQVTTGVRFGTVLRPKNGAERGVTPTVPSGGSRAVSPLASRMRASRLTGTALAMRCLRTPI